MYKIWLEKNLVTYWGVIGFSISRLNTIVPYIAVKYILNSLVQIYVLTFLVTEELVI